MALVILIKKGNSILLWRILFYFLNDRFCELFNFLESIALDKRTALLLAKNNHPQFFSQGFSHSIKFPSAVQPLNKASPCPDSAMEPDGRRWSELVMSKFVGDT
jgi:hypothetical protein